MTRCLAHHLQVLDLLQIQLCNLLVWHYFNREKEQEREEQLMEDKKRKKEDKKKKEATQKVSLINYVC